MTTLTPHKDHRKADYDIYAHHGRHLIDRIHQEQRSKIPGAPGIPASLTSPTPKGTVSIHKDAAVLPVGILGAGPGGLYTALILDSLGIKYEILEASGRTGGRLFTYQFSSTPHDYYDVGAMRFPDTNIMTRLFNLFHYGPLNSGNIQLAQHLIPYYFTAQSNNGYLLYNDVLLRQDNTVPPEADPFKAKAVGVTEPYVAAGYEAISRDVLEPFVKRLEDDLNNGGHAGWDYMQSYDSYSTRGYMCHAYTPSPDLKIPLVSLPTNVTNWLETFDKSTGWYDRALTETVLEQMAFGFSGSPTPAPVNWFCLDGGSQVLSTCMQQYINARTNNTGLLLNKKVTSVAGAPGIDPIMAVTVAGESAVRNYSHVVSTLPLPCLRALDMSEAGLHPMQANALRELQYGPAIKIGIKFKSQWWLNAVDNDGKRLNIVGGQSFTDHPVRTVVYPSYGVPPSTTPTTVLIASYCWTDDAVRLGALMGTDNPAYDVQLKDLVLRDLAAVHNVSLSMLQEQYTAHFSYDWTHNPLTMGAYAFFGPGKFEDLYTSLNLPAAVGRLHFAGEALSVRHAWVVGALDSAWRAVYEVLLLSYPEKLATFYEIWGRNEEWTKPGVPKHVPGTAVAPEDDLLLEHILLNRPDLF